MYYFLLSSSLASRADVLCADATVIPASVRAKVSLRIVPDQDLEEVSKALVGHVETEFRKLGSGNKLNVRSLSFFLSFVCLF